MKPLNFLEGNEKDNGDEGDKDLKEDHGGGSHYVYDVEKKMWG